MFGLRHFAKLSLALPIALIGLGAFSAGDLAAAEQPWTVSEVSGQASLVSPATGTSPVSQGDRVASGHQIETGLNGRVVMTRGGSTVTISPSSRTELPADGQSGRTTLFQALGAILLKIEKRAEQHFEVQTPYLAAVVKGTTFTVTAGAAQSAVHVVEGAVEVGSFATGDVALVRPGQTATVGAGSNAGVSLLGTPRTTSGQSSERSSEDGERSDDRRAQGAGEGWEPSDSGAAATPAPATAAADSPPPQPIARAAQAKAGFAKGAGLAGSGRPVVLDRTVGITSLDFSQLTGGLVRGPKPRSQHANLEPGAVGEGGKAAAEVKVQGQAKAGSKLFKAKAGQPGVAANGAGRNGAANPGQAIANLVRAVGDPGTPSQSNPAVRGNSGKGNASQSNGLALGRSQSASPSASQGNGNAFGKSKVSGSPANSVAANNGNNGNGSSGNNGNGNSGNSGNNGNGNGNGNGNNGNGNNGNGNNGNGNNGNGNGNGGNGNNGNGNGNNK